MRTRNSFKGRILTLLVLAALALTPAVWADDETEGERWLERMSKAVRTLNYEGVFVYSHQGKLESMRLIHRYDGEGEHERLYSLTGSAREIIRDDEKVTYILADDRSVMVGARVKANPLSDVVPRDISALVPNYRIGLQGEGRVADRETRVVTVTPRDQFRYGYRLWVDVEHGLLLRSELINEQGDVVEQLLFTSVDVHEDIPDSWLKPAISGDGFVWHTQEREEASDKPKKARWEVKDLPPGFDLSLHEMRQLPGTEERVEHLLFTDGLASVSVYIEPTVAEQAFNGRSRVGAMNAYGRWNNGYQLTVVGEVPALTVVTVGESLQAQEQ